MASGERYWYNAEQESRVHGQCHESNLFFHSTAVIDWNLADVVASEWINVYVQRFGRRGKKSRKSRIKKLWQIKNKVYLIINIALQMFLFDSETAICTFVVKFQDFRLRLRNQTNPKRKTALMDGPPAEATIYVAKEYPSWQKEVLTILNELYKVLRILPKFWSWQGLCLHL